jgi:renalase
MKKIAIIGAGLSGITLATQLKHIAEITVFEKAKGVGGRMSTHYFEGYEFDHGAQFFTARSPEFKKLLIELQEEEIVRPWKARFVEINDRVISNSRTWSQDNPHYVGVPRMNSIVKYMAQDINIKLNTHIKYIKKSKNTWTLKTINDDVFDNFDWIISTAPAKQSLEILPNIFNKIESLKNISMKGCYSLMLGLKEPLEIAWDAALVKKSIISWISVNSSKPSRKNDCSVVVITSNKWADDNITKDNQFVIDCVSKEATEIIGQSLKYPIYTKLQRWLYANVAQNSATELLIDFDNKIASCGDWSIGGRVENAFLSASRLGQKLKDDL